MNYQDSHEIIAVFNESTKSLYTLKVQNCKLIRKTEKKFKY